MIDNYIIRPAAIRFLRANGVDFLYAPSPYYTSGGFGDILSWCHAKLDRNHICKFKVTPLSVYEYHSSGMTVFRQGNYFGEGTMADVDAVVRYAAIFPSGVDSNRNVSWGFFLTGQFRRGAPPDDIGLIFSTGVSVSASSKLLLICFESINVNDPRSPTRPIHLTPVIYEANGAYTVPQDRHNYNNPVNVTLWSYMSDRELTAAYALIKGGAYTTNVYEERPYGITDGT